MVPRAARSHWITTASGYHGRLPQIRPGRTVTLLHDMLDDGEPMDVLAEVSFLRTSEGGRTSLVRGLYRPNHNFGSADDRQTYVGQIEFAPGDEVAPGESRQVAIRFLSGPGLAALLSVGREWRIQEGNRLVARARLIERLNRIEQRLTQR